MMKFFIKLKFFLAVFLLISSIMGQDKDTVEVSSNLSNTTPVKNCKNLKLGKAVSYPKPVYPLQAKTARIGGKIEITVLVDDLGNVSDITAIKGNPIFRDAAAEAARKAKFSPTICDGQVARIKALLIYNFIPYVISENYIKPNNIEAFIDIDKNNQYYESILSLTENYQLAFGYGDKRFHANAPLTKGDFSHFLRLTLDLLQQRAEISNKIPLEIGLYSPLNPLKIKSIDEVTDIDEKHPYRESVSFLISKYDIGLVNNEKKYNGKYPVTYNEVIDFWTKIFGKDAVPIHFEKIQVGDRILTRGEFSLFLHESLNVLTYKVLP
jgi:TonB family protein